MAEHQSTLNYGEVSCFAHLEFIFVVNSRMSERSIYLRDEAAKCRWHADRMTELETQAALRLLAARYVAQAAAIEMTELDRQEPLNHSKTSEWENIGRT
jgi:hypothetical protein